MRKDQKEIEWKGRKLMNNEREGNKIKSGKMRAAKGIKNNVTLKTN